MVKIQVPKLVIDGLAELSEVAEVPMDKVRTEFKEIYAMPYIKEADLDEESERFHLAFNVIKARYLSRFEQKGTPFEGTIIEIIPTKEVTFKRDGTEKTVNIANIYGVFQPVIDEESSQEPEPKFAMISLYDDACSIVDDGEIEIKKSYRIDLVDKKNTKYYELTSNAKPKVTEIEIDLPKISKILPTIFNAVTIAEAPLQPSKNKKDTKLIKGIVKSARVTKTKKGSLLGFYNIIDHSIDTRAFKENPRDNEFTIRCDPIWVKYDIGSELFFLGRIETSEEYGTGMWADAVLPRLAIPKVITFNKVNVDDEQPSVPEDALDMSDMMDD